MLKLRTILKNIALVAMVSLFTPLTLLANNGKDVGLQLYSLREILPNDVKGTLEQVAKAGYTQVEVYGFNIKDKFWGLTPIELKKILDANKIKAVSGHFNMYPYLENGDEAELKAAIAAAKVLGLKYITIPYLLPETRKDAADYQTLAKRLNYAGKLCRDAGMRLAYHNHDFEFIPYNGVTGLNILLSQTDPKLVDFELDIYWAIRSGIDPVDLFKANPGRFKMWHVKDMDKNNHELNAEIGTGTINYKSLFQQAKLSGLKYFFVEHENNYKPDQLGSVTQSCKYLKQQIL